MGQAEQIWKNETKSGSRIARILVMGPDRGFNWKVLLSPIQLYDYLNKRRNISVTRKNLLFTRQLALDAAIRVTQGVSLNSEMDAVKAKTRSILDQDKKGLYSKKIRAKQLAEIEFLIDYYIRLINTGRKTHPEMIRQAFSTKNNYKSFVGQIQKHEDDVIRASIVSLHQASKRERQTWFKKLRKVSREIRQQEADDIFMAG